jgi:hypothetical protein
MQVEEWRNLEDIGYEKYEISENGRIRNVKTGQLLKNVSQNGKIFVYSCAIEGRKINVQCAYKEVFGRFCDFKKRGIKDTSKETKDIPKEIIKSKVKLDSTRVYHSRRVHQYTMSGVFMRSFSSVKIAAERYDICRGHISSTCCKTRKSCGGFRWSYTKTDQLTD